MGAKLPAPAEYREPVTLNGIVFRHCRRAGLRGRVVRHAFEFPDCDCLRTEIPVEAQAKSSGSLATPGSAGLDTKRVAIHQEGCSESECGGTFTCEGCERVFGWCFGSGDLLGEEHCDHCWCDRLAVLRLLQKDSQQLRTSLKLRVGSRAQAWQRDPVTVARELCEDGFLQFNGAGRFALTPQGREALWPSSGS